MYNFEYCIAMMEQSNHRWELQFGWSFKFPPVYCVMRAYARSTAARQALGAPSVRYQGLHRSRAPAMGRFTGQQRAALRASADSRRASHQWKEGSMTANERHAKVWASADQRALDDGHPLADAERYANAELAG